MPPGSVKQNLLPMVAKKDPFTRVQERKKEKYTFEKCCVNIPHACMSLVAELFEMLKIEKRACGQTCWEGKTKFQKPLLESLLWDFKADRKAQWIRLLAAKP